MSGALALRTSPFRTWAHRIAGVRASCARLTRRHFAIAVAAGGALGLVQGIGHVITQKGVWWMQIVASMTPPIALALALLLGLAIALDVETSRAPRWVPLAIAAAAAALVAGLADWATSYVLAQLAGKPWRFRPIHLAHYAWTMGPYFLTLAAFAAFGARQAIDAKRRTELLRHVQIDRVRVAREAYESRLVALQARVEPRFLFETLSAVEQLYEVDPAAGAQVLDNLIVYLRAALPAAEDVSSTLGDELTLVRAWLDIVRIRSKDRVWFALPRDGEGADTRMPPMILLPLVQHAVESSGEDRGVFVRAQVEDARLRLTLTAGASAFAGAADAAALANVRERLASLYGGAASLRVEAAQHGRSRATIEIPHEPADRHTR